MEVDLRKWRELTQCWKTHIDRERHMAVYSVPLAFSFHNFVEPGNQGDPELDALKTHINTLPNESNVKDVTLLYFRLHI